MKQIQIWEDFDGTKDVIVNYDIHYKKYRSILRGILKTNYEGSPISESTYTLKKLKKSGLDRLKMDISISYESFKESINEGEQKKRTVKVIIITPKSTEFEQMIVIDEVIKESLNEG